MQRKKILALMMALALIVGTLAACGGQTPDTPAAPAPETATPAPGAAAPAADDALRIAFIANQRFGDSGPIDAMAGGIERAMADFGVEVRKLESIGAANFEADIRAMAGEGFDLVITTFPPMRDATTMIAAEFPDVKFAGIFQSLPGDPILNYWNAVFHGEGGNYLIGYIAGLMTQANRIGVTFGNEGPTLNAEANGFMLGVRDANPDAMIDFAFIGSFEDPARAYELASGMIDNGVDVMFTSGAASNAGVVEAAMRAGILVSGEITDFYDVYDGFMGLLGIGFGDTAYDVVRMFTEGTLPFGETGIRNVSNRGFYVNWDTFQRFADNNPTHGPAMQAAIARVKEVEAQIISGDLVVEFITDTPNWDAIVARG